jgi:hypothetical protein
MDGKQYDTPSITPGSIVVIAAFDEVPEHRFLVEAVYEDCITGVALTGPLAGEYGEPPLAMVLRGPSTGAQGRA